MSRAQCEMRAKEMAAKLLRASADPLEVQYAIGQLMPLYEMIEEGGDESMELKRAKAEIERLRGDLARVLEDRARFPDRPDDIGHMIEAHIGNLKHGKDEADRHAVAAIVRASAEIERLRAALKEIRDMKASELAPLTNPGLVHGPALLLSNCQRLAHRALEQNTPENTK